MLPVLELESGVGVTYTKGAKLTSGKLADLVRAIGVKGARCHDEESLACDAYLWTRHAAEIAALGRVRKLQLFKAAGRDLEEALARPELAQMVALDLSHNRLLEPEGIAIARSPHLGAIESLALVRASVSGKTLAQIVTMDAPALRHLDIRENSVGDVGMRALRSSPLGHQLTHLNRRKWKPPKSTVAVTRPKPEAKAPAKPDSRGEELVARLAASFDEATRSVYVDWLLERGDGRAELPAAEAEWLTTAEWMPTVQLRAIMAKFERTRKRLAKEFGQRYRFKSAKLGYSHGLLVEVKANAKFFIENGADLFASEPIRSVCVERVTLKDLPKLAAVPGIQRMSWISISPDEDVVEAALELFPQVSIDLLEPDEWEVASARALPGGNRVRGVSLSRPTKQTLAHYAKLPMGKTLARLDIGNFICSLTSRDYREADDANEILAFGWKLAWVSTGFVSPSNLAKLRAKVPDVAMRYE